MRFFAVLALAAVASAATLNRRQSFPSCANSCLTGADFGSCDPLDDSCLCNSQSFVSSVTNCIEGSCSGSDLTNAESAAQQLCLAVGVTLTATPTASGSSSGSSATSGAAAGSGSATASSTATSSASSATQSDSAGSNGAITHGVNALAALAAVGAAALVL